MSEQVPEGWSIRQAEEIYERLKVPRVYDRNDVSSNGSFPILDQSEDGEIGFIDTIPEFDCSISNPIITFANHTCAVRKLSSPFGVIQNVFPLKNRKDTDIDYIFQILKGGVEPEGYKGHYPKLRETEFLVPPLPEQKKIASILTSVDEVIEKTQSQIDKLQDLKKGTMNELLTKGIGHTEFKDSELGRIPKSWEVKRLGEIGECVRGLTYSPSDIVDHGLLVLRSSNIQNDRLDFNDTVYVDVDINEQFKTKNGDILICVRNGSRNLIGKTAFIEKAPTHSTHGAFMTVFRSEMNSYVQHLMKSDRFFRYVSRDIGATINSINNGNLIEYRFPIPPHPEQKKIEKILGGIDNVLSEKNQKLLQTQSLKKSLMQDLLTGKVRVSVN